jgi:hypothetical protein
MWFRAHESSRQGATATPTVVLLSSFRTPTGTSGTALQLSGLVERGAKTGGEGFMLPARL